MTATIVSFSTFSNRQAQSPRERLEQALSVQFNGRVQVGEGGQLDADYAAPWQEKADALGLNVQVAELALPQFVALTQLMAVWSYCVRSELGSLLSESAESDAYIDAVAAGTPQAAPLPADLKAALAAIVGTCKSVPAASRPLRLVAKLG